MIAHAWIVTALNPKSLTFFVAFLPQFLDPSTSLGTQMADLRGDIFRPRHGQCVRLCRPRRRARGPSRAGGLADPWFNRIGGSLLIGAGITAIAWNRTA